MTASPTPEHNFDEIIVVEHLDEFWHRKWGHDEDGNVVRRAQAIDVAHDGSNTNVHLPSPSYWPIVAAAGLPIIGYGLIYTLWLCIPGGLLLLAGIYGWVFEPADDPNTGGHHHDVPGEDDDDGSAAAELEEPAADSTEDATEEAPVG